MIPLQGDVTSKDSLLSLVSAIEKKTGYINLLVNNSGIFEPILKVSEEEKKDIKTLQKAMWEAEPDLSLQTFSVNVAGVYYTTVAFLDLLAKGNKHRGILGITSRIVSLSALCATRYGWNTFGTEQSSHNSSGKSPIQLPEGLSDKKQYYSSWLFSQWSVLSQ